jgi:hypothetical protein
METKMKGSVLILLSVILSSCASMLFPGSYQPFSGFDVFFEMGGKVKLKEGEDPRIIQSNINVRNSYNIREYNELLSNYYFPVGYTTFNYLAGRGGIPISNKVIIDEIKKECRQNGATIAIYSHTGRGTTSEIVISPTYGGGVSGTQYQYSSSYDCTVWYFAQTIWRDRFGWLVSDLDSEERQKYQRNTGQIVDIVFNNSPVFNANIVKGDIIIRINDYVINNGSNFNEIEDSFNIGDEILVEFIRNNQTHTATILLE